MTAQWQDEVKAFQERDLSQLDYVYVWADGVHVNVRLEQERCVPAGAARSRVPRCWFHKIGNVLAELPNSAHPGAKKALAEIWNAEDGDHARDAVKVFGALYGAKCPKAVAKITDDVEELLAFYDSPAEQWIHLRTTNPIESTFATVGHRTKVTKGPAPRPSASPWPTSSANANPSPISPSRTST